MFTVDTYFNHVSQEEFSKIKEKYQLLLLQPSVKIDFEKYKPDEKGYWYYTYLITTNYSHEFYIGIRHTKDIINDEYIGSGLLIKRIKKLHGINSLYKKILGIYKSQEELYKAEEELVNINDLGSYGLLNLCIGGLGGHAGIKITDEIKLKMLNGVKKAYTNPEYRKKLSIACAGEKNGMFGKKHSAETKAKLSKKIKGRVLSKEWRENLSKAGKGRIVTEATRLKHSIASKGKKLPDSAKLKISLANKGRKLSEASKLKIALIHIGRKHSAETIAKMSSARKLYYEKKRLEKQNKNNENII